MHRIFLRLFCPITGERRWLRRLTSVSPEPERKENRTNSTVVSVDFPGGKRSLRIKMRAELKSLR